ncbi:hypothetical protein AB6N24_09475 [Cellulomonas sp. 179-A 4D5 NHS]|uniref:hypothetical protein n=1 Tax=Cellulomonas sp. 179-A 4D5 NHS TaxID=3142378 RepID=UPI0039A1DC4C
MSTTTTAPAARSSHRRRLVTVGVVAVGLSVAGAGAAMAVAPASPVSRVVAGALADAGVDWSFMPAGYTQAQYEAFWGGGHTTDDVDTLSALWELDVVETKAKAGQMLIDGQALPLDGPRTPVELDDAGAAVPDGDDPRDAFWGAGYTYEDAVALSELWSTDVYETKATAGQKILDGEQLPIAPGSTPAS